MNIKLYDKNNISDLKIVNDDYDFNYALNYISPFIKYGIEKYISNVSGKMKLLVVDNRWILPLFIPKPNKNNSYVASLYSHYYLYAKEELGELKNKFLELLFKPVAMFLSLFLKLSKIDDCVYINNWLLSTNLYTDIPCEYIHEITKFVAHIYEGKPVVWNSINEKTTGNFFNAMKSNNYVFLLSRSIYIQDKFKDLGSRINRVIKKEEKLLRNTSYETSENIDVNRAVYLYNKLYIEKYSKYNPKFTSEFIKLSLKNKLLKFYNFEKEGKSEGIIGFFKRQCVMTTPILGYNTDLPREENLYRILSIKLQLEAKNNNLIFHSSAGAGEFKKSRGAKNYFEYRTIYLNNSGFFKKTVFKFLEKFLEKFIKPMMIKKGL